MIGDRMYNDARAEARTRRSRHQPRDFSNSRPSRVQQHLKDEVDVNTIVRRFGVGQVPPVRTDGVYGDFTGIFDYESAVAAVTRAQEHFMQLPADVREQFNNDPAQMLMFTEEELEEITAPPVEPVAPEAAPPPSETPPASS